ncbi:MAG: 2-phospho-L-lactate guanylyltransferase [Rhodoglobus sp.]
MPAPDSVSTDWVIVVPFRAAGAKSRFGAGDNSALALAMALDTVEVALAVGPVIVVTSDARPFARLGASVIADPGAGLNAAISSGLDFAGSGTAGLGRARAVLLGDHPALTSTELAEALAAAGLHPLSFVADAHGEGTALTAAAPGVPQALLFGAGSAAAHRSAGFVPLAGGWPGLRVDVDTAADLAGLTNLGVRTRAWLAGRA